MAWEAGASRASIATPFPFSAGLRIVAGESMLPPRRQPERQAGAAWPWQTMRSLLGVLGRGLRVPFGFALLGAMDFALLSEIILLPAAEDGTLVPAAFAVEGPSRGPPIAAAASTAWIAAAMARTAPATARSEPSDPCRLARADWREERRRGQPALETRRRRACAAACRPTAPRVAPP